MCLAYCGKVQFTICLYLLLFLIQFVNGVLNRCSRLRLLLLLRLHLNLAVVLTLYLARNLGTFDKSLYQMMVKTDHRHGFQSILSAIIQLDFRRLALLLLWVDLKAVISHCLYFVVIRRFRAAQNDPTNEGELTVERALVCWRSDSHGFDIRMFDCSIHGVISVGPCPLILMVMTIWLLIVDSSHLVVLRLCPLRRNVILIGTAVGRLFGVGTRALATQGCTLSFALY